MEKNMPTEQSYSILRKIFYFCILFVFFYVVSAFILGLIWALHVSDRLYYCSDPLFVFDLFGSWVHGVTSDWYIASRAQLEQLAYPLQTLTLVWPLIASLMILIKSKIVRFLLLILFLGITIPTFITFSQKINYFPLPLPDFNDPQTELIIGGTGNLDVNYLVESKT